MCLETTSLVAIFYEVEWNRIGFNLPNFITEGV